MNLVVSNTIDRIGKVFFLEFTEKEMKTVYNSLVDFLENLPYLEKVPTKEEKVLYSLFLNLCKKFQPSPYGNEKKVHRVKLKYHLAYALNTFSMKANDIYPEEYFFYQLFMILDPKM